MIGRRVRYAVVSVVVLGLAGTSFALAARSDHGKQGSHFSAQMIPYGEVPALNSTGHGDVVLDVTDDQIAFTLTYADLTGAPLFSHIHVGQKGVNGGVSVFFCGGGGKPACPAADHGTVSGTIVAADVIGPTGQGFTAGDFAALTTALRAGVTYANMHTQKFPGGEIRGQIRPGGGEGESSGD